MVTLSPHYPQWFPQSFQLISLRLIGIIKFLSALPVVRAKLASFTVWAQPCFCLSQSSAPPLPLEALRCWDAREDPRREAWQGRKAEGKVCSFSKPHSECVHWAQDTYP